MAQQLHHSSEIYYVVILLLLSYVMSSAPGYVNRWKKDKETVAPLPEAPELEWKRWLNAYTLQPYARAWNRLLSNEQLAAKMKSAVYLSAQ